MRGHLLGTTGRKLEKVGVRDFIDIVYSYAINSPESRGQMRSAIVGYAFDLEQEKPEETQTFEGFKSASLSMLDELDSFAL